MQNDELQVFEIDLQLTWVLWGSIAVGIERLETRLASSCPQDPRMVERTSHRKARPAGYLCD